MFWSATPRMVKLHMEAAADRQRLRMQELTCQAHATASLMRAKRMPELRSLLNRFQRRTARRQTPDEMLAIARAIHASLNHSPPPPSS